MGASTAVKAVGVVAAAAADAAGVGVGASGRARVGTLARVGQFIKFID